MDRLSNAPTIVNILCRFFAFVIETKELFIYVNA